MTAIKTKSEIDQALKLNRCRKNLRREVGKAIADYTMIEEGDKVMVCLSGGKDSYVMLDILMSLQKSAPINFSLHAINLDQKQQVFRNMFFHSISRHLVSIIRSLSKTPIR